MASTEKEMCFICGGRIGRGMGMGVQERMKKLISVSQTVEHSSTIISDILSRILNETVMSEETICRICFNLLNDIDYHLKEAQEKTDEITNKFLDKEKDPMSYHPQPIMVAGRAPDKDPPTTESSVAAAAVSRPATAATTAAATAATAARPAPGPPMEAPPVAAIAPTHSPQTPPPQDTVRNQQKSEKKRDKESRKRKSGSDKKFSSSHHHHHRDRRREDDTDTPMTEDEMSVNIINKNKQKLLSHVLNPSLKSKIKVVGLQAAAAASARREVKDDEKRMEALEEREREEDEPEMTAPPIKYNKRHHHHHHKSGKRSSKRSRPTSKPARALDDEEEDEEEDSEAEDDPDEVPVHSIVATESKAGSTTEFVTVNMDDLGDLGLSKPKMYYARKSDPTLREEEVVTSPAVSTNHGSAAAFSANQSSGRQRIDQSAPAVPAVKLSSPSSAPSQAAASATAEHEEISCPVCAKVFKRTANLQIHIEKIHPEHVDGYVPIILQDKIPEMFSCHLCTRAYTNANSLASHIRDHEEGRISSKSDKKSFNGVDRSGNEPPEEERVKATCPQCNKTFRRAFNMKIHVDRVHNKNKPFVCSTCQKSFATNSDLKQHSVLHGQGKTFACDECGRTFSNRDSIILHRKQHSNTRTHFCKVCDKGFFKSSCLSRHMRTHTGDRPYKCDLCNKGFTQSTTLKLHRTKCQDKGPYPLQHVGVATDVPAVAAEEAVLGVR